MNSPVFPVFIDVEVNSQTEQVLDFGAVKRGNVKFHSRSQNEFARFISDSKFIGGHNIITHDLKYIRSLINNINNVNIIDTLYLSPLLFPNRPYHALLKDDKLQTDELNNPLNDAIKSMDLFHDEINAFERLNDNMKYIYNSLLSACPEFAGFFTYICFEKYNSGKIAEVIKSEFSGRICENAKLDGFVKDRPIELAYCLALISASDKYSVTPPWVIRNYPAVENIIKLLSNTRCSENCNYCRNILDVNIRLQNIFGYPSFRLYDGEPLQEKAADAAVNNRSLLAIFPTGGGKSITFQLPALIAGETQRGLTVVISPLQSLMKDQVDNLSDKGITDAVTVNGLLSHIERAEALERVESGLASLLYISPESLRSSTIERLLLSRNIARFVIDEAHCFSAWGQDFRVDYQYIGDFIAELQKRKNLAYNIPVSCFTATAKQKVISDIRDYFKQKLNLQLELYATNAARSNLRYEVLYKETNAEKYTTLRELISTKNCPTIVYVSRIKRTKEIAKMLTDDGFTARSYNGKMDSGEKIANQESFMNGETQIIVATSAFGMGVDKQDVGLVVHYDISDSLENYVQEAGRAGRNENINADCYVLFNNNDLDKHFVLLNQTKLSIGEIGQVWKAIKDLMGSRKSICRSPLEIARQAGWDYSMGGEMETRVKTAIAALESAGYIKRGRNSSKVHASSIMVKTMAEASEIIESSSEFNEKEKQNAVRIMSSLISSRSQKKAAGEEAESRTDYLAEKLGLENEAVVAAINIMRKVGLLADAIDTAAYIRRADNINKSLSILQKFSQLEGFLLSVIEKKEQYNSLGNYYLKEINGQAEKHGIKNPSVKAIKTILYYYTIRGYIQKTLSSSQTHVEIIPLAEIDLIKMKYQKRIELSQFIVEYLYDKSLMEPDTGREEIPVGFSELELINAYAAELNLSGTPREVNFIEVEDALLYLSKIGALNLEGGFAVTYNAMRITRTQLDNKIKYKKKDYEMLDEFYRQKMQQIHIVGEYANMMVRDYNEALRFVSDYFRMDYKLFIKKYFKGERLAQIERNITPERYRRIFDGLSPVQAEIIGDKTSKYIAVAAGPGSGKTRILVHKLASILMTEDVKHEQLLMLTFSRAAATEFKQRLSDLIGNAAYFVEIKTFHSYCYDLLGRLADDGNLSSIVKTAVEAIKGGEIEINSITKSIIVIDEAQDMDENEYALIEELIRRNDDMRVIAVGDDDQNIYEFRGSSSKYLKAFIESKNAAKYELLENYRSKRTIVEFANAFAMTISGRIKTNAVKPVSEESGVVRITKHTGKNLIVPIVNTVKSTYTGDSACVLTGTNEEALCVMGLLLREGLKAKLVGDNKGFNLYDLAELRHFMKLIDTKSKSPTVSDEIWDEAKQRLQSHYKDSANLELCLNLLGDFERSNVKKYKNSLEIFIKESHLEDFFKDDLETITVSTIHKSKGREFSSVYMCLSGTDYKSDESKRLIYVGMTRAKDNLYIHTASNCFDMINAGGVEKVTDSARYHEPDEIVLQLGHEDVNLGFFKGRKSLILNLRSGNELSVEGNALVIENKDTQGGRKKILYFSKKFTAELEQRQSKGYIPYKAKIRFVLAWKGKGDGERDEEESAIVLPDVYFRRGKE